MDNGRTDSLVLRLATMGDAEQICRIYNHEVTSTVATFDLVPRSLADQQQWITDRNGAFAAIVAIDAGDERGDVVGFASLSPYKERPAYRTTVEDSVYVSRDGQGAGVGTMLLGALVDTATSHGFHAVMARIVGGHDASINLHARFGFEVVGTEREVGRKFGRWLDVVVMQKLL